MANDITGFGVRINLVASKTFPAGLELSQFADDNDPLDAPSLEITASAMGLNGDKVSWTVANSIPITINMIANSSDDTNLGILFESNRAGRNKASAKDQVTMIITYADGHRVSLLGGTCDAFVPADSISSEGRFKSKPYIFSFENRTAV